VIENPVCSDEINLKKQEDRVRQSVHRIRDAEVKNYGILPSSLFLTPWDVDEFNLLWDDTKLPFSIDFYGQQLLVSPDTSFKDPEGCAVVTPRSLFYLQFVNQNSAETILRMIKIFRGQISSVSEYSKSLGQMDKIVNFCNKLDKVISREARELASEKIVGIFDKMVKEMGGDTILPTDRVANRVKYFLKISDRFKKDRARWQSEMLRLGLLG